MKMGMSTPCNTLLLLLGSGLALAATPPTNNSARQDVRQQAVRQVQKKATTEQQWSLTLGAGAGTAPLYEGSRAYALAPLAYAQGTLQTENFGQFSLGNSGLGWTFLGDENWQATLLLNQDGGRDETYSGSVIRGNKADQEYLKGMGRVKSTMEGGLALQYQLGPVALNLQAMQDLLERGHKGIWVDLGIGSDIELAPHWSTSVTLQTRWADADYMQSMFGVDATQSANSGFAQYHPGAGIKSVTLGTDLSYEISDHWSVVMMLSASDLVGDAEHSPIVQNRYQYSGVIGTAYHF